MVMSVLTQNVDLDLLRELNGQGQNHDIADSSLRAGGAPYPSPQKVLAGEKIAHLGKPRPCGWVTPCNR